MWCKVLKIYFHTNNKATRDALQKCGVKNVFISFKYSHDISTFSDCFDNIFISTNSKTDREKYYDFLKREKEHYTHATQYYVDNNMSQTYDIFKEEMNMGLNTLPVLEEDYVKHLSLLGGKHNHICIGKMHGRFDTEDSIKRLPTNLKYHGMGKGKYLTKNCFDSVDTSLWISAAMAKKFEIWYNNSTIKMDFRKDGKLSEPVLKYYCDLYKDNMEKIGINWHGVQERHYYTLLKLPIALYYMPICKYLNSYSDNFIK